MNRKTQDEWAALIAEQQSSSLTIVDFCKETGLATSSFYKFRKRLQPQNTAPKFIQAKPAGTSSAISVNLGDISVTISSSCKPVWLASFIKALQA